VIARPRVQGRRLLAAMNRPLILVYMWGALSVHAYLPLDYDNIIDDWILLLKDFPHQAWWKLFEV